MTLTLRYVQVRSIHKLEVGILTELLDRIAEVMTELLRAIAK